MEIKAMNTQISTLSDNLVTNGWFQNGRDYWVINSGSINFINENACNWLQFKGDESCQVKQTISIVDEHKYFLSLALEVTQANK